MTSEICTVYGDVQYSHGGPQLAWRDGWVTLYCKGKRIFCSVHSTVKTEEARVIFRVKPRIIVCPKSLSVVEEYGHLQVFIQDNSISIKRNSGTVKGSLSKLAQLFLDLGENKPIVPMESHVPPPPPPPPPPIPKKQLHFNGPTLDEGIRAPFSNGNNKTVTPVKHPLFPRNQTPQSSYLSKADLNDIVENGFCTDESDPEIDECIRKARSILPKEIEIVKVTPSSTVPKVKRESLQINGFSSEISGTQKNQSFRKTPTSSKVGLAKLETKKATSTSTTSKTDLNARLTPTKALENIENFKPSTTNGGGGLGDSTPTRSNGNQDIWDGNLDEDFMKVASIYLPDSNPPVLQKPVSVRSFYSSSNCSRFPLTSVNTNSMPEKGKRRLHNALSSYTCTRKKQKTSPDFREEKKTQKSSSVVNQKRFDPYIEDNENEPKRSLSRDEVGFTNIGNSCYMNSVLQCLLHITCFTEDLCTAYSAIEEHLPELSITRCLMSLMSAVQKQKYVNRCILEDMLKTICKLEPTLKQGEQHDAQEFLCQLLSRLNEECEKALGRDSARSYSVRKNFQFEIHCTYECTKCKEVVEVKEELDMLSVEVPPMEVRHGTLQTSLEKYFQPQKVKYTCKVKECKATEAWYRPKFASVPRVVVVHLMRYSYETRSMKLDQPVTVPMYLTLKEHTDKGITVDIPQRKIHQDLNTSHIISSMKNSPLKLRTNCSPKRLRPRRSFQVNVHDSPFTMRGGQDDFPPSKNEEDKEQEINIEEMSEEAQMEKALALSLMDIESQEEQEIQEVINRSLQDSQPKEFIPIEDASENFQEFEHLENPMSPHTYQLVSIIDHKGRSVDSGHYVCDIYNHQKSTWWRFNDDFVSETTASDVLNISRRSGYLFFYVSRDILNAP